MLCVISRDIRMEMLLLTDYKRASRKTTEVEKIDFNVIGYEVVSYFKSLTKTTCCMQSVFICVGRVDFACNQLS